MDMFRSREESGTSSPQGNAPPFKCKFSLEEETQIFQVQPGVGNVPFFPPQLAGQPIVLELFHVFSRAELTGHNLSFFFFVEDKWTLAGGGQVPGRSGQDKAWITNL